MLNKLAIFVDRSQYGTPNQLYVIETSVFRLVHRGENRVKYRLNNILTFTCAYSFYYVSLTAVYYFDSTFDRM